MLRYINEDEAAEFTIPPFQVCMRAVPLAVGDAPGGGVGGGQGGGGGSSGSGGGVGDAR